MTNTPHQGDVKVLRALLACLRSDRLLKVVEGDSEDVKTISGYVARSISPNAQSPTSSKRIPPQETRL
jgi:hypothetical protein